MVIEHCPASSALGAVISGIDLAKPINSKMVDALKEIWAENLVMIFRNQSLSDDDLIRFSSHFGECEKAPIGDSVLGQNIPPEITVVSNVKENGKTIGFLGTGELTWHTDMSYIPEPADASGLYAIEVANGPGGETSFLNMFSAFETLPSGLLDKIKGRTANHDSSYTSAGTLRTGLPEVTDVRKAPGAHHPLLRTHPVTGRTALYLGRRPNCYILNLPVSVSETLLDEIWSHTTQKKFVYQHRWAKGDFVFWDNRCVMHRREPFNSGERRIMHRTQLKGTAPYYCTSQKT
jgi:taurine dioxygenase